MFEGPLIPVHVILLSKSEKGRGRSEREGGTVIQYTFHLPDSQAHTHTNTGSESICVMLGGS